MPNLNALKGRLREKEKTYARCAAELGISTTAFSEKMNGKSKFTVEEANSLACFLNLSNREKVEIFLN